MTWPSSTRTICRMYCGGTAPAKPAVRITSFTLMYTSAPSSCSLARSTDMTAVLPALSPACSVTSRRTCGTRWIWHRFSRPTL
eukprot:15456478-Alexandrium_andersonii.AAC.1